MLHKLLRAFITILGTMALPGILMLIQAFYGYLGQGSLFDGLPAWMPVVVYLVAGAGSAALFYVLSQNIALAIERGVSNLERRVNDQPSMALLSAGIGLILGLIVAALFSVVIGLIPVAWVSVPLIIIFYIIFGYLGFTVGMSRKDDITRYFNETIFNRRAKDREKEMAPPKILDAAVLIDGRIFDIAASGVFDGEIVVPSFILEELERIAASDDPVKRSKGRRGLDLVGRMQSELEEPVAVADRDYPEIHETKGKLLRLARDLNGKLVTIDYGLNKVARLENIGVFNLNELTNALKPILTTGEEIWISIVKRGKERGQGVGYLDDGTMVVVDDAADCMDETILATVTSVLQTAAGRMVFAKRADTEFSG